MTDVVHRPPNTCRCQTEDVRGLRGEEDSLATVIDAVGRSLPFGEFLHCLEVTGEVKPRMKLRESTNAVIPYLETPLIWAHPPLDGGSLTARVIDSVVQHFGKREAHDASCRPRHRNPPADECDLPTTQGQPPPRRSGPSRQRRPSHLRQKPIPTLLSVSM
jgi:hypothetical protein